MNITLKDGSILEVAAGATAADAAKQISGGLFRAACAAKIDGKVVDLRTPLTEGCALEILTFSDDAGKNVFWHTSSHILAQAVQQIFPDAKFAIGPAIENGFYYDFDLPRTLTTEDLTAIEAGMKKIVKSNVALERFELPADEALKLMGDAGQEYKTELIAEHAGKGEAISFYKQGAFTDLCAGPHLMSTGGVKAIKLTSVTGAYWRGDASKKMLQRIYGISFPKKEELQEYITRIEEAKKRDHRKLGKELGLFMLRDEGPGFPFFLPKGMVLRNTLIDYWRQVHKRYGYVEISTPMMMNRQLWERSGHWGHYKDNMYTTVIDDVDFAIKPMNCPGGMLVYASEPHSYRDLPLRVGELGLVHRHELSGALHGLFRVRCFTQDAAHIFMTWGQMKDEIKNVVKLFDEVYS
ncbi:MAG: threonine--tRNA ligase, partial [Clostridia bacterium]|nr:threonine--tRNA ligase [Clostridia bacterium]